MISCFLLYYRQEGSTVLTKSLLLLLFYISFSGYYLFLLKKGHVPVMIPGSTVSAIVLFLFFGGLFNTLPLFAAASFMLGIALFLVHALRSARHKAVRAPSFREIWPLCFIIVISLYSLFMFRNAELTGYDDFSHWANIARCMLLNDRLPRFSDTSIMFQSYPPGTALFIYYVEKIFPIGEKGYLFAQYYLKICFLCSLFHFHFGSEKWWSRLPAAAVILLLSMYNVTSFSLSVDTVLSCSGIFCICQALAEQASTERRYFSSAVAAGTCLLIKNSGLFFYLITAAFLLFFDFRKENKAVRSLAVRKLAMLLIPLAVLILWQKHVDYAFIGGLDAKHTMTISHAADIFRSKSKNHIMRELLIIGRLIFDPRKDIVIPVGGAILLLLLLRICSAEKAMRKKEIGFVAFFAVFAVLYELGVLGMYVFSMPHSELIYQNGADYARYNGTMAAFLSAIWFVYLAKEPWNRKKTAGLLAVVSAGIVFLSLAPRLHWEDHDPKTRTSEYYRDRLPLKLEIREALEKVQNPSDGVLVRATEANNSSNYIFYMMRYLTQGNGFEVTTAEDDAAFDEIWRSSDAPCCIDTIEHTVLYR